MDTKEIWKLITSQPKWYAGIRNSAGSFYNAQSANYLKSAFKKGLITDETIERIFKAHGYTRKLLWIKN